MPQTPRVPCPWETKVYWVWTQPTLWLLKVWWLPHNSCQFPGMTLEGTWASFIWPVLLSSMYASGHTAQPFHRFPQKPFHSKYFIRFRRSYSVYGWYWGGSQHSVLPPPPDVCFGASFSRGWRLHHDPHPPSSPMQFLSPFFWTLHMTGGKELSFYQTSLHKLTEARSRAKAWAVTWPILA